MSTAYANQLRKELASGFTVRGAPLSAEMLAERLAKLRRRAGTLGPRYRLAELARLGALEAAMKKHITAETNRGVLEIKEHITASLEPLIAASAGRLPPERDDQPTASRMKEVDQALASLRGERRLLAERARDEREDAKREREACKGARMEREEEEREEKRERAADARAAKAAAKAAAKERARDERWANAAKQRARDERDARKRAARGLA